MILKRVIIYFSEKRQALNFVVKMWKLVNAILGEKINKKEIKSSQLGMNVLIRLEKELKKIKEKYHI